MLITFLLNEIQFYYGDYNPRYYRNPNFPTIIIASILFFSAFCKIQISKASNIVLDIADKSMLIYLVHPIFMVIFKRGIKLLYSDPILPNPFWYVPLMFLFSVFCSYFISKKINHLFISK